MRREASLRRLRALPRHWLLLLCLCLPVGAAGPCVCRAAAAAGDPALFRLSERALRGRGIDSIRVVDETGRERLAVVSVEGSAPRERRFVSWIPTSPETPLTPIEIPTAAVALDAAELGLAPGPELVWVAAGEVRILAEDGRTLRREALDPPLPLPARTWEVARHPWIQDWDGDGRLELLLPGAGSVVLFPLIAGDRRQALAVPWTGDFGSPTLENWFRPGMLAGLVSWPTIALGDDDGDGHPDVFAADRYALRVFRGGPDGLLGEASEARPFPPFSEEEERRHVANTLLAFARDVDGDGRTDLVVHRMIGSLMRSHAVTSVHRNAGNGADPSAEPWTVSETRGGTAAVELADIDGDGRVELLEAHIPVGVLQVIRILTFSRIETRLRVMALPEEPGGPPRETFVTEVTFPFDFENSRVLGVLPHTATDWNGDGLLDLCWGDGDGVLSFRLGEVRSEGPGYGSIVGRLELAVSGELAAADLDGDGLRDLVVYDPLDRGGTLHVGLNRGALPGTPAGLHTPETPESG